MRFLFSVILIINLFFFFSCKTVTEEEPTVSSSPPPVEQPEEEVKEEKPHTIIVPTGSLGNITEVRKKMLEKTLESALDEHFDIVPKDLFEEAQEKAFEELDYEECTEEQCIMMIKEILQVENSFQLVLMEEDGDTQLSLTWNNLDKKRVEEEYCEGCKTKDLRNSLAGMVDKFFANQKKFNKNISKNIRQSEKDNCKKKIERNTKINFSKESDYIIKDKIEDSIMSGLDISKISIILEQNFICMKIEKKGNVYPFMEKTSFWFNFDSLDLNYTNFGFNVYIDFAGIYKFKLYDKFKSNEYPDYQIITKDISSKIEPNYFVVGIPVNGIDLSKKYLFTFMTHHTIGFEYINDNGDRNDKVYYLEF